MVMTVLVTFEARLQFHEISQIEDFLHFLINSKTEEQNDIIFNIWGKTQGLKENLNLIKLKPGLWLSKWHQTADKN